MLDAAQIGGKCGIKLKVNGFYEPITKVINFRSSNGFEVALMAMLLPEREIPLLKFWTNKKIDNYLQNIREKLFDKNMSHLGISIRKHY